MMKHVFKLLAFRRAPFKIKLPGFDEVYYLYWYPDVRADGIDPMTHYLTHGWVEERDPSAGFSTGGYLRANADVRQAGVNPLIHFLDHGLSEGRGGWQKDPKAEPPRPKARIEAPKLLSPPR